jgi:diguanylate cyclase (GGDEF)-like protein/PAS domain S-box-containing protein
VEKTKVVDLTLPVQVRGETSMWTGPSQPPALDLNQTLQLVADTIVESLGFEVAVINLVVDDSAMLVAAVTGPDAVREALLHRRQGLDGWRTLLEASEQWGRLRFLDHAKSPVDPADIYSWIPDEPVLDHADAWHPEDALFAPLESSDGHLLGMMSVDLPKDGLRPGPATRRALESYAVTAALAIEHGALAARAQASNRQFEAVFDSSPVAIALLDNDRRFVSVNAAYCTFLHRSRDEILGRVPGDFTHPEDLEPSTALSEHVRSMRGEGPQAAPVEKRYLLPDGSSAWGRLHLVALATETDDGTLVIAQVEDITDRKRAEAQLVRQANFDALTGLPNRSESMRRLRDALELDHLHGAMTAVFFCDLDRLKLVNDTHGHAVGDAYIREVSRRIRAGVRDQDVVGRLSGDEFVVVVQGIGSPTEAIGLAGRIVEMVREPLHLAGERFTPSLSLGIAYSGGLATTADDLLAEADSAMYRAKIEERGAWHVFDPTMRNSAAAQLALRNDLADALAEEQFVLHYQPIVRLDNRAVMGYEALLRWQHPRRGLLMPSEFIDVILASEYESPITEWILQRACFDASQRPEGLRRVSVNVSSLQVGRRDLPHVVQRCLTEARLDPSELVLELTEDRLLSRPDGAELLNKLHALGVRIALDDFGTGYAGLGYLQRFPSIDVIKLDRSFIASLGEEPVSEHIVRAVVELASSCGLQLVTEGVETERQAELLQRLGVRLAQGYLLGKPGPVTAGTNAEVVSLADRRRAVNPGG